VKNLPANRKRRTSQLQIKYKCPGLEGIIELLKDVFKNDKISSKVSDAEIQTVLHTTKKIQSVEHKYLS